jgi:hypothetical protein
MGPVDVMIISFPDAGLVPSMTPLLEDLVNAGHVRIVDAILVTKGEKGNIVLTDMDDRVVPTWSSISSMPQPMLSAEDAALAFEEIGQDGAAVLFVIEHLWPRDLARLAADCGGTLQLHARIDPDTVETAAKVDA